MRANLTQQASGIEFLNAWKTKSIGSTFELILVYLVHRLANNGDVAGGQLAAFQGASEAPISESYGSSEQRGKTAKWPRPGGLR